MADQVVQWPPPSIATASQQHPSLMRHPSSEQVRAVVIRAAHYSSAHCCSASRPSRSADLRMSHAGATVLGPPPAVSAAKPPDARPRVEYANFESLGVGLGTRCGATTTNTCVTVTKNSRVSVTRATHEISSFLHSLDQVFSFYSHTTSAAHDSTMSASVSSLPTFPGNTTYGTPRCRLVSSSHFQRGTPGAA